MFSCIYIFSILFIIDGHVLNDPSLLSDENTESNIHTCNKPQINYSFDKTRIRVTNLISHDTNSDPYNLLKTDENFKDSGFKENNKIKIIIPDWQENLNETWITDMISKYLTNDYNVIVVDWQNLSKIPNYFYVIKLIDEISVHIFEYLEFLNAETPLTNIINKKVHIIGNGLGAHIAGFVGSHFSKGNKIDRITGLDPTSNGFENAKAKKRLNKEDAVFVDVIHTCIDMIGITQAIGDVDFYPNYGECGKQVGCIELTDYDYCDELYNCGHKKAAEYMVQSISEPKKFLATKNECGIKKTAVYMGENVSRQSQGRYLLKINENNTNEKK